jgi:hypothetical protein
MDRNYENGKHAEVTRACSNPRCQQEYIVQHGGQKSGTSPAVHVENLGEIPKGYCSTDCVVESNGWKNPLIEIYQNMGLNYAEVHPKGYLSPARRPKNTYEGG